MLLQQFWVKLDVAWLVHTVHIAKSSRDGEIWADLLQSVVDLPDVFGLRVQGVVVDIFVVHAIFFTASNANFLRYVSRVPRMNVSCCLPFQATASWVQLA